MATTTKRGTGNGELTKPAKAAVASTPAATAIEIDAISREHIRVPIVALSPLLVHRFSEKAKKAMLNASQGRPVPKEPKDPQAEYQAAFYRLSRRAAEDAGTEYGFPAEGFKKATVGAARFYGGKVTMTALRQFIFISGVPGDDGRELVPIYGPVKCDENVVRVGKGTDLRYRPMFGPPAEEGEPEQPWSAVLDVMYFDQVIKRDSVLSLIDAGGMAIGVGDWRPERDGPFGKYTINKEVDIEVVGAGA